MPSSFHNDANELRSCLLSLGGFTSVEIYWETDVALSNAMGERHGKWMVVIETARNTIRGTHAELTNALWYASTLANAANSGEYERREQARKDALAKLSPEDRKVLGV